MTTVDAPAFDFLPIPSRRGARIMVETTSLTSAWVGAFLSTYDNGDTSPLVVTITGFTGMPPENLQVRARMDELLMTGSGTWRSQTTASTIFPASMWQPGVARDALYSRYLKVYDRRLQKIRQNSRGTYFQRLISYGPNKSNQLERVIDAWNRGIKRRSAFVTSVFDPETDQKPVPFLGFPCMHQVCFAPQENNGFAVTGFYAKQDIFDRGYGNYLGLARLGLFMADAFGRELTRVTCVASVAGLTNRFNKGELAALAGELRRP